MIAITVVLPSVFFVINLNGLAACADLIAAKTVLHIKILWIFFMKNATKKSGITFIIFYMTFSVFLGSVDGILKIFLK